MPIKGLALDLRSGVLGELTRVETSMRQSIAEQRGKAMGIDQEEWVRRDKQRIPMGRYITEKEVVDGALFLVSDRASSITGVALPIDGGFLAV